MKYKIGNKSKVNAAIDKNTGKGVIVSRTFTRQGVISNPDCEHCGGEGYFLDTDCIHYTGDIDVSLCDACHPECFDKEQERYNMLRETKYPGATNEDIDRFELLTKER